jgi:glycosyltransferase involved in cell wall biosynthesis
MNPKITALVPTFNNENIIRRCLDSVKWTDEILVVDSFSTDGTLEICRDYTDKILQHEYINSADQKNWAIPQAAHDWALIVDTDERVTDELREEIQDVLRNSEEYDGFRIPRRNYSFGKLLRHGGYYPDYQLRLFKRDLGRYEDREVHAHVVLNGPVGTLKGHLLHYCERNIDQIIQKYFIRYTAWEAEARERRGETYSPVKLVTHPLGAFLYRYFWLLGFLDGLGGLRSAAIWSFYLFITYLKLRAKTNLKT